jgi:hypothetical protein
LRRVTGGWVYPEEDRVTSRGTKQRPAVVCVRTEDRAHEILALCQEHGIQVNGLGMSQVGWHATSLVPRKASWLAYDT